MDVFNILEIVDCDLVIDKISEVIVRWNVLRDYDKQKNNCQNFIDDILAALNIDPETKFKGQLGDYLKQLRMYGVGNMNFSISHDLRGMTDIKESSITFKSHQELDKFVQILYDKAPDYLKNHPEEEMLLKSFDRAFWLKHYNKKKNIEEASPLFNEKGELECPFKDPKETRSFGGDDWSLNQSENLNQ